MPNDAPDFDLDVVGTLDDRALAILAELLVDLAEAEQDAQ